jgi:hypothetical protein
LAHENVRVLRFLPDSEKERKEETDKERALSGGEKEIRRESCIGVLPKIVG